MRSDNLLLLIGLAGSLLRLLTVPLVRRSGLPAWSADEAYLSKLRAWRRAS
jgi:hypothetical protein